MKALLERYILKVPEQMLNISCTLAVLAFFVLTPPKSQAQIFTAVNDSALIKSRTQGFGCAFFDYNNDDKLDILLNNYNARSSLFQNNGDATFSSVDATSITDAAGSNSGLTLGDFDNDGDNDLFLLNMNGIGSLIQNNNYLSYSSIPNIPMTKLSGFIIHCTWVDYDNDGSLDLFIPACGSSNFVKGGGVKNYLYHNDMGVFTRVNTSEPENTLGNNVCANFSDIDNDGDMDLFMTDCQVENHLFENDNGTFKKLTTSDFSNPNSSIACSWGDYDNDGFMDLFVANGLPSEGVSFESYLYHNNGNKTFSKVTTGAVADFRGNSWNGIWADFDNDGDLDLFVGTYSQADVLFINNGDGSFQKDTTEFNMSSRGTSGACFGDYNNDGFLDLFTGNAYATGHLLYKNNGNENNWLFVKCIGTVSNRTAIGARVKIKATISGKSCWQYKEINGNMGFRSVSEIKAHFGLGDASVIDSLIIEWPSKQKSILTNIQVNQTLTITEDIPQGYLKTNLKSDVTNGYSPLRVQFNDASICDKTNPITSWSWDFNDDGVEDSKEQNPVFTFNTYEVKDFSVSLTVSNGSKTETFKKSNFIHVIPSSMQNIAINQTVTASSVSGLGAPEKVVDGIASTYWFSAASDSEWIQIELDSAYNIGAITLRWIQYYAKSYNIKCSEDGNNWQDVINIEDGNGNLDSLLVEASKAKYIKFFFTKRSSDKNGYRISEIGLYRPAVKVGVNDKKELIPEGFNLKQNYPNPFNPETVIGFQLSVISHVTLKIYDMLGREVVTLVNEEKSAGYYSVKFNASELSSGIYFYRLQAGSFIDTKKLILMK